jgi:hypothetical protein
MLKPDAIAWLGIVVAEVKHATSELERGDLREMRSHVRLATRLLDLVAEEIRDEH